MSNLTDIKTSIHNLSIATLIESYGLKLTQRGPRHIARCPFHNEDTPSFTVDDNKGFYHCFGCGKNGDAISFVQEHQTLSFMDAIKDIAQKNGLSMPEYKSKEEQDAAEKEFKQKQSLYIANKKAVDVFLDALVPYEEMNYIINRVHPDVVFDFKVGYAPDEWHYLHHTMRKEGFEESILLTIGLLSESKGKTFDFFRHKIIFPIHDENGNVVGFSGRYPGQWKKGMETPKYINSPSTIIFNKSKTLYGLYQAKKSIKQEGFAFRVEGPTDVISMHAHNKTNTICPQGTALTEEHVLLLKKYTQTVVLFSDGDKAGLEAILKDGPLFIQHGFNVSVLILPKGQDPDSFLKSCADFDLWVKENIQDYFVWQTADLLSKAHTISQKADILDKACRWFVKSINDETKIDFVIDNIIKKDRSHGPKKKWTSKISSLRKEEKTENEKISIPKTASIDLYEKYGFYEDDNSYYFRTRFGQNEQCSNFILKPLFHLESTQSAKRLFEIKNEYGYALPIEFAQKDLISLSQFRLKIESIGNFLWSGGEPELIKLKRYLYDKTDTAKEIMQIGWNKEGFWAWANGIFDGENFKSIDKYGVVNHNNKNYYLPAFAMTFEKDDDLFQEERKYLFESKENEITLYDYVERLVNVFGDNAKVAFCYLAASLFRDVIVRSTGFFPILNIFGPKNTGKSALAKSMLRFFGKHKGGPNITNTTKPALAQYVGHLSNGLVHLEEYKNNINDLGIYEFLKGLWESTGRSVMDMELDKKKKTSRVDTGVILTGQEMPTCDIALFTRLVYITFSEGVHTNEEKEKFNQLKRIEEEGINHLIHHILKHRKYFEENWFETYKLTAKELGVIINKKHEQVQDRIFNNWVVLLAAFRVLDKKLNLSFQYKDLIQLTADFILTQNKETSKGDELGTFWDTVLALSSEGSIREEVDFRVEYVSELSIDEIKKYTWEKPTPVLMLNHSRVFKLYRKMGKQSGETILPIQSLEYYLKSHKSFLGKKTAVAFKKLDPVTNKIMEPTTDGGKTITPRHITTAYCFRYDALGVQLTTSFEVEDIFSDDKIRVIKPYYDKEEKENVF